MDIPFPSSLLLSVITTNWGSMENNYFNWKITSERYFVRVSLHWVWDKQERPTFSWLALRRPWQQVVFLCLHNQSNVSYKWGTKPTGTLPGWLKKSHGKACIRPTVFHCARWQTSTSWYPLPFHYYSRYYSCFSEVWIYINFPFLFHTLYHSMWYKNVYWTKNKINTN